MRLIDCGTSGDKEDSGRVSWADLSLPTPWGQVVSLLSSSPHARPAQVAALRDYDMLNSRRHLIVAAPTNAGKSLTGLLVLLDAVRQKRRAILLEPLRAIAQEKVDELREWAPQLSQLLGVPITVRISTGDYRLEDEELASPPVDQGELIVATPERLEAILRNPEHDTWLQSIGAVCVDEAHLISAPRRGPTLEYLITSLLCMEAPPRLVLLSGTLGDTTRAAEWLAPCDVVSIRERQPPLKKQVLAVEEAEDVNDAVVEQARCILSDRDTYLLVFVYQTKSTLKLAEVLQEALGDLCGSEGALAYHGQMSTAQRAHVRCAFIEGASRCVVSTTALGQGVNLPATHVLIRDNTYHGEGSMSAADLLQMMGRAGRGDRAGQALVVVKPTDRWSTEELVQSLREEALPALTSHLDRDVSTAWKRETDDMGRWAALVASLLARQPEQGIGQDALELFFSRSLAGPHLAGRVGPCLDWLADPQRVLAYKEEDRSEYQLTKLGLKATRAVLPLPVASGAAQLLRDLMSLDGGIDLLAQWSPLDHLLIVELLEQEMKRPRRAFSKALAEQVDGWMEAHPELVSLLYKKWIAGQKGASRACEVMGSLGVESGDEERDRKSAYQALCRAIVLYERGQGRPIPDVERQWGMQNVEGIEERWRDTHLWLLSGLAKIWDVRCFYYHLKEECQATDENVQQVKRCLRQMKRQILHLQQHIKYCSPLGSLAHSMRRSRTGASGPSVGLQTIRRLEGAGIQKLVDLVSLDVDAIVGMGVRRDLARQIHRYVRRRLQ